MDTSLNYFFAPDCATPSWITVKDPVAVTASSWLTSRCRGPSGSLTVQLEPMHKPGVALELVADGLENWPSEQKDQLLDGLVSAVKELLKSDERWIDTDASLSNCRMRVIDAKFHEVDSSAFGFRLLMIFAVKACLAQSCVNQLGEQIKMPQSGGWAELQIIVH